MAEGGPRLPCGPEWPKALDSADTTPSRTCSSCGWAAGWLCPPSSEDRSSTRRQAGGRASARNSYYLPSLLLRSASARPAQPLASRVCTASARSTRADAGQHLCPFMTPVVACLTLRRAGCAARQIARGRACAWAPRVEDRWHPKWPTFVTPERASHPQPVPFACRLTGP